MGQSGSLILLPTFNEKENLPLVVPRLHALDGVDGKAINATAPFGTGDPAGDVMCFANLPGRMSG